MRPDSPLLWTPEAREHVRPRRAHGVRLALPEGNAARQKMHALYILRRDAIVQGATHGEPEHAALQQKAIAYLEALLEENAPFAAVAAAAAALLVLFERRPHAAPRHRREGEEPTAAAEGA